MFWKLLYLFQGRPKHAYYCRRICKFMFKNSELDLSSENIYKIFKLYQKWLMHVEYKHTLFEKTVLHYIALRVFWSDFSDSPYICKLLRWLYNVENHFEFILYRDTENSPAAIDPSFSVVFASYFLGHTNFMGFELKGRRFVDVPVKLQTVMHPCEAAVKLGSPELLHMFLQYGALTIDSSEPPKRRGAYTNYIRRAIIDIVYSIQELRRSYPRTVILQEESQTYTTIVSCGKLLARVCPQLSLKFTMMKMVCRLPWEMQEAGFMRSVPDLRSVAANDIPELEFRIFSPMSLKHACRLKIRKKLYDKWQLPHGIEKLPIPHTLKDFLNLYTD